MAWAVRGWLVIAKIMVVDDDPGTLDVLGRILSRNGYEVIRASSGEECLQKVLVEKPELIFLDIALPGIDGWEVCRRIKKNPLTCLIPVVMLSSWKSPEDVERSLRAGADRHLGKPINFSDVLRAADALLRSKQPIPAGGSTV